MTLLLIVVDAALTFLAGAAVVGLVDARLTLFERTALAAVTGVMLCSAATFGLSLVAGLNALTVIAAPLWVIVMTMLASRWTSSPHVQWRSDVMASLQRWRSRVPFALLALAGVTGLLVALIYRRTVYIQDGNVLAGYETVWADWSQHLTTASSFAIAQNVPPTNPLFSGTPLLYPFLPDFHGAMLMTLGLDAGTALALGSAALAFTLVLLVVALGRRLGLTLGGAVVATAICVVGGGLGFVGLFGDACTHSFAAAQCSGGYLITHPGDAVSIVLATVHNLGGSIAAQPRSYDGLLTAPAQQVLPNQQWYTPLFAWWLPQRSMLYGFDLAVGVLLLVLAGVRERRNTAWAAFAVAGVLLGVMPLVHAQTLFAVVVLLAVVGIVHRRREWIALLIPAALFAGPRLVQIALSPHGQAAAGNLYPYFEPGWEVNATDHLSFTAGNAMKAVLTALRLLGTPGWWGFWMANLGPALPLCIIVGLAALARVVPGRVGAAGRQLSGFAGAPLLQLLLGAMVIFVLCDVVIFQSWDWDNTKLLVYWYLVAGLLAGAVAAHWWRRGWWRTMVALLLPATMLFTGTLTVLRLLPWTPPEDAVTGPYTVASADEVALAAAVVHGAPDHAVFLTFGRPNDPLLAVAGRISLLGYYGWLWSYGTDFGTRVTDVDTMYAGCDRQPDCPVAQLLHQYHVSYVEIDDRLTDSGAITQNVGIDWWSHQGYPVVARSTHITVYDVRGV